MSSRKLVVIMVVVVSVVISVSIPVLILESRRTPDWQAVLVEYLEGPDLSDFENGSGGSTTAPVDIQSVQVAEARFADALPGEMMIPLPAGWTWEDVDHFPPAERVLCVRLVKDERATDTQDIPQSQGESLDDYLVVSYHDDGLYRAGWLVQEFRAEVSQDERLALFDDLGCDGWKQVAVNE